MRVIGSSRIRTESVHFTETDYNSHENECVMFDVSGREYPLISLMIPTKYLVFHEQYELSCACFEISQD